MDDTHSDDDPGNCSIPELDGRPSYTSLLPELEQTFTLFSVLFRPVDRRTVPVELLRRELERWDAPPSPSVEGVALLIVVCIKESLRVRMS